MGKTRLEAFSDGVIAIIITIMVLELKAPHESDIPHLFALAPVFFGYLLSFVFVGIYWNNHHHLLHAVHKINGATMWANLHLLFWLSLIPFATNWMSETGFAPLSVALYGLILLLCGVAYYILTHVLLNHHGKESMLAKAIGSDKKGILSLIIYGMAIPFAFIQEWVSYVAYIAVAVMWLIPDKRIERALNHN